MTEYMDSKMQERYDAPEPEPEFTALAEVCRALGWQGGTIHQVREEIARLHAAENEGDRRMRLVISLRSERDELLAALIGAEQEMSDTNARRAARAAIAEAQK